MQTGIRSYYRIFEVDVRVIMHIRLDAEYFAFINRKQNALFSILSVAR